MIVPIKLTVDDFSYIHWDKDSCGPESFQLIIHGESKFDCDKIKKQILDNQEKADLLTKINQKVGFEIQGNNIVNVIRNLREARKELKHGLPLSADIHIEYCLDQLTTRKTTKKENYSLKKESGIIKKEIGDILSEKHCLVHTNSHLGCENNDIENTVHKIKKLLDSKITDNKKCRHFITTRELEEILGECT